MARVLNVISPHLDDAALSCCLLMAAHPGSYLTTVFADGPVSVRPTSWAASPGWPDGAAGSPDAGAARARQRSNP